MHGCPQSSHGASNGKPLDLDTLKQVRWAHYLHHNLEDIAELRFILPNGRWLNPLNGQWVRIGKLTNGKLPKEARSIMATAMASAEDEGAGPKLMNDYELKRFYEVALKKLQEDKLARASGSLKPVQAPKPTPVEEQGKLSIRAQSQDRPKRPSSSDNIEAIPSLEMPPKPAKSQVSQAISCAKSTPRATPLASVLAKVAWRRFTKPCSAILIGTWP